MPRFSLKTMLFAVSVVALWLSTASGYLAAEDVRASIMLLILLAAFFAVLSFRGRRQMFWIGFVAAMLMQRGYEWFTPSKGFGLKLAYDAPASPAVATLGESWKQYLASTVDSFWMLCVSAIAGFIAVYIYDQSRKPDDG